MRNWIVLTILLITGALAAFLLVFTDNKHKEDREVKRAPEIYADSAKMERECVPVALRTLRELVSTARTKHHDFDSLGNPHLNANGEIEIGVGGMPLSGKNLLMGNHDNGEQWDPFYEKNSHLHFRCEPRGEDTVVYCPSYLFVQLVIWNEK